MSAARVAQDVNTHFIHFLLDRKNIFLISPGSISQWQGSEQISTPNSRQTSSRSWWGCQTRSRVRKWTKLENFPPSTVALTANGSLKSLWRYTKWAFICLLNTSCKMLQVKVKVPLKTLSMTHMQVSVNEAAAQICRLAPAMLTRRDELFPLARQVLLPSYVTIPWRVLTFCKIEIFQ